VSFIHAEWQADQNRCLVCNRDRTERPFSTLAGRITDWPACGFSPFWIESASAAPESIKTRPKAFTGRRSQKASISPYVTWSHCGEATHLRHSLLFTSPLVNDRHCDLNRPFGSESAVAGGTKSAKMNPECPISASSCLPPRTDSGDPYEAVWCSRVQTLGAPKIIEACAD
jgi:hypothetical protein